MDQLANALNLDLPFLLETGTRQGLSAVMEVPKMLEELQSYIDADGPVNYYQAGMVGGKLMKKFFDLNIDN